jgi:hypothetical protein
MNSSDKIIEKIVQLMAADDSADAPAESVKWVKDLFKTRHIARQPSLISRVVAILTADLSLSRGVAGERSKGTALERQMLFTAGDAAVDLRVGARSDGSSIRGQILGDGYENAKLKLSSSSAAYETQTNELAEFSIEKVKPGIFSLSILGAEKEIVIEELDLSK